MSQKKNFFPVFLIFFILSILLFVLSRAGYLNSLTEFFENITIPIQRSIFRAEGKSADDQEIGKLKEENARLVSELVKQKDLERENQSFKDQFQTQNPNPRQLLPAEIIGVRNNELIIDKGQDDGLKNGAIVVYKDNLVGKISRTSQKASIVDLVHNKSSLTAKTLKSQSSGIIKSNDGRIIFDNITLSEKLEKRDLVITKGDEEIDGSGFPPGLVIGRIRSINKKASNLFQTAEVESLIDFPKLEMVFVIIE